MKWRVFDQTLGKVRSKFSDLAPDALEDLIAEASAAARKETRRSLKEEK